jgi:hypothetical protein
LAQPTRVPWWVAWPCNLIGLVAIGLPILDPDSNWPLVLCLLIPMAVALYGTALVMRLRKG